MRIARHNYTGYCQGCRCDVCKQASREYRATRKEKANETTRAWRAKNKERLKQYEKERYAKHGERMRAINRIWQQNHKQERKVYHKKWIAEHRERARFRARSSYLKHKDRASAYGKSYRERNREKLKAKKRLWKRTPSGRLSLTTIKHNRRAVRGKSTKEQTRQRMEMFGNKCWLCRADATEIDHVIPIALGGTNFPANLRPICRLCNASKGKRHPRDITLLLIPNKL